MPVLRRCWLNWFCSSLPVILTWTWAHRKLMRSRLKVCWLRRGKRCQSWQACVAFTSSLRTSPWVRRAPVEMMGARSVLAVNGTSLSTLLRGAVHQWNSEISTQSSARDWAGAAQHGCVHRSQEDQGWRIHIAGRPHQATVDSLGRNGGHQTISHVQERVENPQNTDQRVTRSSCKSPEWNQQ